MLDPDVAMHEKRTILILKIVSSSKSQPALPENCVGTAERFVAGIIKWGRTASELTLCEALSAQLEFNIDCIGWLTCQRAVCSTINNWSARIFLPKCRWAREQWPLDDELHGDFNQNLLAYTFTLGQ